MVKSPYSNNPADNAAQGKISGGKLNRLFDAPVQKPSQFDETRAVYMNRLQQRADDLSIKKPVEAFKPIPGFKDSELVSEAFTQEDYTAIICLLVAVIVLILAGATLGFWSLSIRKFKKKCPEEVPSVKY